MKNNKPPFEFADLFAGIGGFAAALTAFGGAAKYAVEIDDAAAQVYKNNWKHMPSKDITVDANESQVIVPKHQILTGGFPCQPFSKSGAQKGMDEIRGTLFFNIMEIIKKHHPEIVLLENVRNLAGPRHTHEWKIIIERLENEGYVVSHKPAIISPHQLPKTHGGRPQVRERVFITATYAPDQTQNNHLVEPVVTPKYRVGNWNPKDWKLNKDLPLESKTKVKGYNLTENEKKWITAWSAWVDLYRSLNDGKNPPGFPIWVEAWVLPKNLKIPAGTPKWKADFLQKNAELYGSNPKKYDAWIKKYGVLTDAFPPSRRKLEWQAQDAENLWKCVMHFRPSGIRAKKPNYLPALVAITQTSIIGSQERRLTSREAARLQGLPEWFDFGNQKESLTYKQLGNGVNVGVVWHVLKKHVERDRHLLVRSTAGKRIVDAIENSPDNPDEILKKRPQN